MALNFRPRLFHNSPLLLLLLLLLLLSLLLIRTGSRLLIPFECRVEPPADQAALIHHLLLAGAALLVVFASSLLGHEIAKESVGRCG